MCVYCRTINISVSCGGTGDINIGRIGSSTSSAVKNDNLNIPVCP